MSIVRLRSILWLTAALAGAGGVMAIVLAVKLPLGTVEASSGGAPRAAATRSVSVGGGVPPLASFASAWRLHLRRALVDPPAPVRLASAKTPNRAARPGVRLIGTIVDGAQSKGLFITGIATIALKGVGQAVAGAKVVAVEDNSATLSLNGETFTLKRERNPFDPTGAAYDTPARASVANETSDPNTGS
jgi:hypothetical protein